ncbi:MAG TPA: helix-turn-helix transcriptional regulator [Rickettsiales bacterium]|nr:helix-turn-helix transcriptional regulator [Rickettsiales bacterium]
MQYSTHMLRDLRRTIGRNITRLRTEKSMPQPELACLSNVSKRRLKQYELGKHKIDLESMCRIACILDVHVKTLLDDGDMGSL